MSVGAGLVAIAAMLCLPVFGLFAAAAWAEVLDRRAERARRTAPKRMPEPRLVWDGDRRMEEEN